MDTRRIIEIAERAGAFPIYPGRKIDNEGDNTIAFRERALVRFFEMIVDDCAMICEEHGKSAEYSYTPAKALVAKKTAFGCAELMKRKFNIT